MRKFKSVRMLKFLQKILLTMMLDKFFATSIEVCAHNQIDQEISATSSEYFIQIIIFCHFLI